MGVVYRATDLEHERTVALKLLAPHLAQDTRALARFHREAAAAAQLQHPHIAALYEFGEEAGQPFIAFEWIEGQTLQELLIAEGPLPLGRALTLFDQLAQALDAAHLHGIIHRDVKPANILVDAKDHATLVDFGLAWLAVAPSITATGAIFGTPRYMSPEQIEDKPLDGRSDLYSLALVLYEMLAGRPPFDATTTPALLHQQLATPPPSIREINPRLPSYIQKGLEKALAKNPADRFPSGAAMSAALHSRSRAQEEKAYEDLWHRAHSPKGFAFVFLAYAIPLGIIACIAAFLLLARPALTPQVQGPANSTSTPSAGETNESKVALPVFSTTATSTLTADTPTATGPLLLSTSTAAITNRASAARTPTLPPTATLPANPATATNTPAPTPMPSTAPTRTLPPAPPAPTSASPNSNGMWSLPGGDAARSGIIPDGLGTLQPNPRWTYAPGAKLSANLLATGGHVIMALDGGKLRAIDWKTSTLNWETPLSTNLAGPLAIYSGTANDYVIVPTIDGLHSIITDNGNEAWHTGTSDLHGIVAEGVDVGDDGTVYAATDSGWLNVLDPLTGKSLWTLQLSSTARVAIPPALTGTILLVASSDQQLYAVNLTRRTVAYQVATGGTPVAMTIDENQGIAYLGTNQGHITAFAIDTGAALWTTDADSGVIGFAADGPHLFATTVRGSIYAWNSQSGAALWHAAIPNGLNAPPLTNKQSVIVSTPAGDIRFYDTASGTEAANRRISAGHSITTLAPAGGWLYTGGDGIVCFSP